jgi:hypothetical protein
MTLREQNMKAIRRLIGSEKSPKEKIRLKKRVKKKKKNEVISSFFEWIRKKKERMDKERDATS